MITSALRASLLPLALVALLASSASAAWSPPTRVPGSASLSSPYDVAVRPDGTAAVAFGRGDDIRVTVRRSSGRWLAVRRISHAGRAATGVDISFDGRGRLVAVWVEELTPGRGPLLVRTATRSRAGRWSRAQTAGITGHYHAAVPRIATNHRGDAAIVWRGVAGIRGERRGAEAVRAVYRPAGRRTFGRARTLEARPRELVTYQQVALGEGGRAYAVWTNVRRQLNRMAVRSGARWSRPVTISDRPSSLPVIAVAGGRDVVVAWHRATADSEGDGTQWGPVAARWRRGDGTLSPVQELSALPVHQPGIAVAPAGEVMLAYSSEVEIGDTALHYAVARSGAAFAAEQVDANILAGGPSYAPTQRVGYVAEGTALVVYGGDGIKSAERPPEGAFSAPATISRTGDFPMLATAGNRAVAVWVDGFQAEGAQRLMLSTRLNAPAAGVRVFPQSHP